VNKKIPLLAEIERLRFLRSHQLLSKINLHPSQSHLLLNVSFKEGLSQQSLAKAMMIKPSTLTVMLKRMEKNNLIVRKKEATDARILRVYLSDQGKELVNQIILLIKQMEDELYQDFTKEEKDLSKDILNKFKENLKRSIVDGSN
jgi:DNA-binding MarR family transcriptional regulator